MDSYGKGDLLVNLNDSAGIELEERDILESGGRPSISTGPDPREKGFFERVRDMFS